MTNRINPIQQHHLLPLSPHAKVEKKASAVSFKDLLNKEEIKVSKHAAQRLEERNIHINDKEWQLIAEKMNLAKEKGITDSLVVTNHAALLVSTKNNTVVTAMNREEAASRIFTNINGTILINE